MIHFGLLQWLTCRIIDLSRWRSHIAVHGICSWKCLSVKLHKITNIIALSHYQLAKNWNLITGRSGLDVNGSCSKSLQGSLLNEYTYSYTVHTQLVPWCCKSDDWIQQAFIVWMFSNSIICHLICTEAEAHLRFHNNGDTPVGGPEEAWSVCSCVLHCTGGLQKIPDYWLLKNGNSVAGGAILIISMIRLKRQMRLQTLVPFVSIV